MHTPPPTHATAQPDPTAQPGPIPASPAAPPTPLSPPETASLAEITADAAARDRDEEAWCTRELIRRRTHPTPPAHPRLVSPRPADETEALPLEQDTV